MAKVFALAGNPNSGKTTLFNSLTGATAKTGNWPGVTVEKKTGKYREDTIVDLPGIYSLSPYSPEEIVSRNFVLKENVDCVINIVDGTNLERNLYLTLQLLETDVPVVVALNMADILNKKGVEIDVDKLSMKLGVPVMAISALKKNGLDDLIALATKAANDGRAGKTVLRSKELADVAAMLDKHKYFNAAKLIENDELICSEYESLKESVNSIRAKDATSYAEDFANERYSYISNEIIKNVVVKAKDVSNRTEKVDKVLTHRIWGLPIFLLIMFSVFHLTFSEDFLFLSALGIIPEGAFDIPIIGDSAIASPGIILFNIMDWIVGLIGDGLANLFANAPEWCSSLIVDGVWGGVGAILSFVPNILVLFFFIAILEDCGYMSRIAYLMDKIFKGIGLSGKAFIPLLSCFGCAVPGIMATKTLKSDKERRMTIMLTPFFSCGAKLPIWTAFALLLFDGAFAELIVFGVYIFGIIVAIITAAILNKIIKGKQEPFIMEMPDYHMPQGKNIGILIWDKCKHYVVKAGTLIAASTVVLWFLTSFAWNFSMVEDVNDSIIGSISNFIAPIFWPLGWGGGEFKGVFVIGAFAGLIAKEEVPAIFESLGLLEAAVASVAPAAIFSYMAFNLLVVPCMAAVATARGELNNKKHFWLTILFWVATAYISAMLVYLIASLISVAWWVSIILVLGLIAAVVVCAVLSIRRDRMMYGVN
ncbi:MAG: ferrous iron transport protein B [Erysipelotrichaceae bacterium]|nr:ferrous iron transport protein B [Erysipelotrichaceae bacterium]